jgi:hypothetical protein
MGAGECTSGFCVDRVCCESACGQSCFECRPGSGRCESLTCGLFRCVSDACPNRCADDAACVQAAFCDGAQCQNKKPPGALCKTDHECTSNSCLLDVVLGLVCL